MKLLDIIDYFSRNYQGIIVVAIIVCSLIQIAPIQLNPWDRFGRGIRSFLTKDLKSELQEIKRETCESKEEVYNITKRVDDNEVWRLRHEILDFSNSCKNGRKHTKDEFEHILEAHDRYETIIVKRNIKNGVMDVEHRYIRDTYRECLESDGFLK